MSTSSDVTVVKTERDPADHAYPRMAPTQGVRHHEKAAQAVVPAPDDSTRSQSFAAGSDPQETLRSPLGHFFCTGCQDQAASVYSAARARTRPGTQAVITSRMIEGPNTWMNSAPGRRSLDPVR